MSGFEVRPCGPTETQSWAEFLDRNFGYQSPQSYAVDFAPLFDRGALERSRLVFKNGRIVASATLYPIEVVSPARRLKLGVVGAVATDEGERGQGLSTRVLGELEAQATTAGLDGLILWSDQAGFYARAGYVAAGRQLIYSLEGFERPRALAPGTPAYGWSWPEVRSLYERHRLRVARTEAYWRALENVKSVTRVQWLDASGRVSAYLGFDRGRDLSGIIHEWGGEPAALLSLVWTVLQSRPELLWLTHPALADAVTARLPSGTTPVVDSTLALFKSLNANASARDLERIWFWGLDSL